MHDLQEIGMKAGAPDWIRTSGLCLRRAALYPAELRVPGRKRVAKRCAMRQRLSSGLGQRYRLKLAEATASPSCAAGLIEDGDDIGRT